MSLRTRRWSVLAALALCVALVGTGCIKNGEAWNSAQALQAERDNAGLGQYSLEQDLIDKAQAWAEEMSRTGVRHSNLSQGVDPRWTRIGENVGWARSIDEMHSLFMNSSAHRGNILSNRFTAYGTGVAVVDGRYYVVQVFAA